jgi:hypothetical protein
MLFLRVFRGEEPFMTTVTGESYRDRILGYIGERDPVESLATTVEQLRATAMQLGPEGLARPYAPGKWTGAQVLAHLADAEMAIGFRIRQILAEDNHRIQGFDEGAWARRYDNVDADVALQSLVASRRWNLALLRRLTPEMRARQAIHPDRGPETLELVIRLFAGHDLNHLAQLESLLPRSA